MTQPAPSSSPQPDPASGQQRLRGPPDLPADVSPQPVSGDRAAALPAALPSAAITVSCRLSQIYSTEQHRAPSRAKSTIAQSSPSPGLCWGGRGHFISPTTSSPNRTPVAATALLGCTGITRAGLGAGESLAGRVATARPGLTAFLLPLILFLCPNRTPGGHMYEAVTCLPLLPTLLNELLTSASELPQKTVETRFSSSPHGSQSPRCQQPLRSGAGSRCWAHTFPRDMLRAARGGGARARAVAHRSGLWEEGPGVQLLLLLDPLLHGSARSVRLSVLHRWGQLPPCTGGFGDRDPCAGDRDERLLRASGLGVMKAAAQAPAPRPGHHLQHRAGSPGLGVAPEAKAPRRGRRAGKPRGRGSLTFLTGPAQREAGAGTAAEAQAGTGGREPGSPAGKTGPLPSHRGGSASPGPLRGISKGLSASAPVTRSRLALSAAST